MSEEIKMDADYFIKKFEAIPDNLWCVGSFEIGERRCALGHCSDWASDGRDVTEYAALSDLLPRTVGINDGHAAKYRQPTPRARILAALEDIKAEQPA